jgi:hypothetical protein
VGGRGEGEMAQTMCTHVSKCKINKIKERKKEFTGEKMKFSKIG